PISRPDPPGRCRRCPPRRAPAAAPPASRGCGWPPAAGRSSGLPGRGELPRVRRRERVTLEREQLLAAGLRGVEHGVQGVAAEGGALRGALHLDELAAVGAQDRKSVV